MSMQSASSAGGSRLGKFEAQRGSIVGQVGLLGGSMASSDSEESLQQGEEHKQRQRTFMQLVARRRSSKVSAEELDHVRTYIMKEVTSRHMDACTKLNHLTDILTEEVNKLKAQMADLSSDIYAQQTVQSDDLQRYSKDCREASQQELSYVAKEMDERMKQGFQATWLQSQQAQIQTSEALRQMETNLEHMGAQQSATTAVRWGTTVGLLSCQRKELSESIEEVISKLDQKFDDALRRKSAGDDKIMKETSDRAAAQAAAIAKTEDTIKKFDIDLKDLRSSSTGNRDQNAEYQHATERRVSAEIATIRMDADRRIMAVESEARRLTSVVSEVENIPTRRVEWVIKDAAFRVEASPSGKSFWSPKFEAAGAHGLQLELRLAPSSAPGVPAASPGEAAATAARGYVAAGTGSAGSRRLPGGPSSSSPEDFSFGDCALFLWSVDVGLRLVCRLYVGGASEQHEHVFDGVTPCGSQHFGAYVREHINRDADTLSVGVEFLEAIREVRNAIRPALPTDAQTMQRSGVLLSDGAIVCHRHLCHRTLDLVQTQVDLMNSRMVRRIEWRLEKGSTLRSYFPEGESLCSTKFEAAGVGDMQLVFYPSGYAGAKEGYCSFFLHCPGGSALRCWLVAGKQSREAKLCFEEAGFFGRTNFCRFESCVEADDSVMLVLEIDEAQATTTEWMWHQPAEGRRSDIRPGSANVGGGVGDDNLPSIAGEGRPGTSRSLPAELVESRVALKRAVNGTALEDVKRLPSVWTSQAPGALSEVLDGYHTFGDLKATKKLGPGGMRPVRPPGSAPAVNRVAPRYLMYAT